MFEHLDDPQPFAVDDDLRVAVAQHGRRRQRRARLRTATVSLSATLLLFAGAVAGYARWQVSRIDRVPLAAVGQVDEQGNAVSPQAGNLDEPFTLLVIGNDSAPEIDGRDDTNLADSIMLVRIDKPGGTVRVASIPRDTLVTFEDGSQDRINAARRQGIPALVRTINRAFGVTVDHYAEAHFQGFEAIVDAIGGVPLYVERPVRDTTTGLDLAAGCQTLDGTQALALARSRHFEAQEPDGRWLRDPSSDLGRISRQQLLGIAAAEHAAHTTIGGLDALVGSDPSQITLDDRLGIHDLLDLGSWVGGLPSSSVITFTPQVRQAVLTNGAAVLTVDDEARAALRRFLLSSTPASPPGTGAGSIPVDPSSPEPVPTTAFSVVPDPAAQSTRSGPIRSPEVGGC